jgi:exopolysaccharide biosynthesis polyprenyl glycosylphosphotransferase
MKRFQLFLMVIQVPLDFLLLLGAGISAYFLRFTSWATELKAVTFGLSLPEFIHRASWFALLSLVFFALLGLYRPNPNRKLGTDIIRIFAALSSCVAVVALYIMFTQQLFDSRFLVAASYAFAFVYIGFGRFFMWLVRRACFRMNIGQRKVAIIGHDSIAQDLHHTLESQPELGYTISQVFEKFDKSAKEKLEKHIPDEIIFANPRAHEKESLLALQFADAHHITFKYSADLFSTLSANTAMYPIGSIPIVELKRTSLDGWGSVIKRIFDIVLSLLVIVLVSPIMLFTAIVIWIETGRPIIYKNERVGIHGHKFFTFKFRSMYQKDSTGAQFGGSTAEEKERDLIKKQSIKPGPIYKIQNDPRVTPFGRFIRRWSIDELPQFFNVFIGTMSIVGPRPHQPREVELYEEGYRKVFALKPGITGLSQVSGRSDLSFEDEMRLDVLYIEKWNLGLDIIIFIKTPFILFKKRKAL